MQPTSSSSPLPLLPSRDQVRESIITCERCPRLRDYCAAIAAARRRAYQDYVYWARPVPGFGDPNACVLIVGLAPGAHGANRTGRPFTGDGSGNFMYPVLYDTGFASQPTAVSRDDGLKLRHAWIASVVRCAPPNDKPLPQEVRNCSTHLAAEIELLPRLRVVVGLGRIAWDGYLAYLLRIGLIERRSAYPFGHGTEYVLPNGLHLLAAIILPCATPIRACSTARCLHGSSFARVPLPALKDRDLASKPTLLTLCASY